MTPSQESLQQLIDLGVAQGYWTVTAKIAPQGDATSRLSFAVRTSHGDHFFVSTGGWRCEGKITARMHSIRGANGVQVSPSDVLSYQQLAPEASASADRGAETLFKTLRRRLFDLPQALDISRAMQERLASLQQNNASLADHVQTLQRLGFDFRNLRQGETHSTTGYGPGRVRDITVRHNGECDIKNLSVPITKIEALLALLKD